MKLITWIQSIFDTPTTNKKPIKKPELNGEIFSKLPYELITEILLFYGLFSFHRGIFIFKIPKSDARYFMLYSIPRHRTYNFSSHSNYVTIVNFKNKKITDEKSKEYKIYKYDNYGDINYRFVASNVTRISLKNTK